MGNYDWSDEPFVKQEYLSKSIDKTLAKLKAIDVKPRDASKTSISYELIQRVGMWSLCNVEIQQFTEYGMLATRFRLVCKVCSLFSLFDYGDFLEDFKLKPLVVKMEAFCSKHRHEVVPSTLEIRGTRMFNISVPESAAPIPARRYRL